jgi:hypothetical protein
MTSDEFNSRYRLLKQMAVKEGESYTAEHVPSGRAVLVHMLEEDRLGGAEGLRALIERLDPRDRARVLDTFTVDGSLVVVTQFLQHFEGLEQWFRARATGATPPPSRPDSPREAHGEFTRLFRSPEDTPAPGIDHPPQAWDQPVGGASAPGSNFTDLFRAPVPPPEQTAQGPTIPPVRMVGVRLPVPSEPALPAPPLRPPDPQPPPIPPKLTPNFETSAGPGPELAGWPSLNPPEPQPGPAPLPKLSPNFEASAGPPPELAGWPGPDEVVIRAGRPASAPMQQPSWGAPSEYTRVFGSVPQSSAEPAPPVSVIAPPQETPERKRSYVPLFLVLNLLFILATGLVLYFVLRRC